MSHKMIPSKDVAIIYRLSFSPKMYYWLKGGLLQNAFNNCNLNGCYLNGALCLFSVCNRLRRVPASVAIQTCNQTRLNNNYLIPLCQMTISLCYPFATTPCVLNVFFKTTTWKIDKNNFQDLNFEVISLWKNLSLKQLLNCLFNLYECVTMLDFFLFFKKTFYDL